MRTGIIAQKLGMTRLFDDFGMHVPVTVLKIDDCRVLSVKTKDKDGYSALKLGFGYCKDKHANKAQIVEASKKNFKLAEKVKEFRVSDDNLLEVGTMITASHFEKGCFVDIQGVTIGKGFAGGMKRWNFRGMEASHGVLKTHRSSGSTGQRQDPGKTFKGKKMPGHMGCDSVTVQNLQIVDVDNDNNLLFVKGAVPGCKYSFVFVKDSEKRVRI